MAQYFIDMGVGDRIVRDLDGSEYNDLGDVREEMLHALCDLSKSQLRNGNEHNYSSTARAADGTIVMEARLSLTVKQL